MSTTPTPQPQQDPLMARLAGMSTPQAPVTQAPAQTGGDPLASRLSKLASQPAQSGASSGGSTLGNLATGVGHFIMSGPVGAAAGLAKAAVLDPLDAATQVGTHLAKGEFKEAAKASPGLIPGEKAASDMFESSLASTHELVPDIKKGDYKSAYADAIGSLPGGAAIRSIGDKLGTALAGDYDTDAGTFHVDSHKLSAAIGDSLGLASNAFLTDAPKLAEASPEVFRQAYSKAGELANRSLEKATGINHIPPEKMVTGALRGSVPAGKTNFIDNLTQKSMPAIKAVEQATGRKVTGVDSLLGTGDDPGLIKLAKQQNRAQFKQMTGAQSEMGAQIDGTPIADAMEKTITDKMKIEDPAQVKKIQAQAANYRRPFSVEQMDSILQTTNDELNTYYAKNPIAKGVDAGRNPDTAILKAQADSLRKTFYSHLDSEGNGAAARELQQRYGALTELQESLYKRKNVQLRAAPINLSGQISRWSAVADTVRGVVNVVMGRGQGLADIAQGMAKSKVGQWIQENIGTDAMLSRAFNNFNKLPDAIQMPAQVKPAGLLEAGARQMPGVADDSGSTGRVPQPGAGISPHVGNRLLNGPTQTQQTGFNVIDAVPVRNPKTGKIEYVPRHWAEAGHLSKSQ